MKSGSKRATLSSYLVAGRRGGSMVIDPTAAVPPIGPAANDAAPPPGGAPSGAATPRAAVLFDKGAASAAGFRPAYWSYQATPNSRSLEAAREYWFGGSRIVTAAARISPRQLTRLAIFVLGCCVLIAETCFPTLSILHRRDDGAITSSADSAATAPRTTADPVNADAAEP